MDQGARFCWQQTTKNEQARIIYVGDNAAPTSLLEAAWAEHEELKTKDTICPWVFHRGGKRIMHGRCVATCERLGIPVA